MRRYSWLFAAAWLASCADPATLDGNEVATDAEVEPDLSREAQEDLAFVEERLHDDDPSDDAFYAMVRDLGGLASFEEALATQDHPWLAELHAKYGLEYGAEDLDDPELDASASSASQVGGVSIMASSPWSGCPVRFATDLRNKTFNGQGQQVHLDGAGRPAWAKKSWVPFSTAVKGSRDPRCQRSVGHMGTTGDVGGHMIPDAVGGWGGRANMVPQNGQLNNGPWRTVENQIGRCLSREPGVEYTVRATYPSSSTVRPSMLVARLALKRGGVTTDWRDAEFNNRAPTPAAGRMAARFKAYFDVACFRGGAVIHNDPSRESYCVGTKDPCGPRAICCNEKGGISEKCVHSPRYNRNFCYWGFRDVAYAVRSVAGACLGQARNPLGYKTLVRAYQGWEEDGVAVDRDYRGDSVTVPAYPTYSYEQWQCGWPNANKPRGLPLCPEGC